MRSNQLVNVKKILMYNTHEDFHFKDTAMGLASLLFVTNLPMFAIVFVGCFALLLVLLWSRSQPPKE